MTDRNPFAPPEASVADHVAGGKPRDASARKAFPWLFVLRYVVGVAVLISGLVSLWWLSQAWATLADRAIIDPMLSPYRYLPVLLLKVATGVAILARSRFSLVLTVLWIVAFSYAALSNGGLRLVGPDFLLNTAVLISLLSFQCLLLARGRLR
jgi:hypothetical protein